MALPVFLGSGFRCPHGLQGAAWSVLCTLFVSYRYSAMLLCRGRLHQEGPFCSMQVAAYWQHVSQHKLHRKNIRGRLVHENAEQVIRSCSVK